MMKNKILVLVCLLPIAGVLLWRFSGGSWGSFFTWSLVLACPLSHLFLMKHDHKEHAEEKKGGENDGKTQSSCHS